jgi:elongator complex protein 1
LAGNQACLFERMKNLVLLGEQRHCAVLPDTVADRHIVDTCLVFDEYGDFDSSRVVLTNDGIVSRLSKSDEVDWICKLDDVKPGGGWFYLSYVDPELVCLSKRGAIVTVSSTTGEAVLVGVFDHGLEAGVWSPDGEVLLIVTSVTPDDNENETNSVVLTMNSQFEVLAEVTIDSYIPSRNGAEYEVSVAWRPDGRLCSVSSVDSSDSTRKVRIYKRDTLELKGVGRTEDASGTLTKNIGAGCLAWAGAGCSQLLASVQQKGKKTKQVIFFESNGLQHREFVLNEAVTTSIIGLDWNADSDLLAVTLREESGTDKIQLWHRSNYLWYLKQEFRYPGQAIQSTFFDEETTSKLYVLLRGFEWRVYEVRWDPSAILISGLGCSAYVVDGCTLNTTMLDKALVPPPMYMTNLKLSMPINHIALSSNPSIPISLLVCLSDGSLVLLDDRKRVAQAALLVPVTWNSTNGIDPLSLRSFLVVGGKESIINVVAIACAARYGESEKLVEVSISLANGSAAAKVTNSLQIEDSPVIHIVNWSDSPNGAILQLREGTLLEYEQNELGGTLTPSQAEPLLEPCPWIVAIRDISSIDSSHQDVGSPQQARLVVGLSRRSRLYCRDFLLTDSASSFFLSMDHQFLCYATAGSRCQLRFLPFSELSKFDPLMGSDQNQYLEGYEPRNVERGTRLVAVLPAQPLAVLQMPRGNIEGVYPRALVLRYVMTSINNGDYGNAFLMMRRQKIDLNLLVDMNPWNFLQAGIRLFVEQVQSIDHLNLFISCLQDFDVTLNRFPIPHRLRRGIREVEDGLETFDFSSKVNAVCRAARVVMLHAEQEGRTPGGREVAEGHFLLPILSTFAKESQPQLKEALSLIKMNALKNHPASSKKPPLFSEKAQASIHYLAFLAEYELLFENALAMYDYDLARAVARNSQMDPKIYMPLLKRLRSLPIFYGRYEIDLRLKHYESCLENLVKSGSLNEVLDDLTAQESTPVAQTLGNSFEDCMSLIEKHNLHRLGLELFRDNPPKHHQIMLAFGESLLAAQSAKAALAVFCAARPPNREGAMRAARACGDWQSFFSLLEASTQENDEGKESFEEENRRKLAREIVDKIAAATPTRGPSQERRDAYFNAARILLDYCNDPDGAVDLLLAGEMWSEGRRVACLQFRPELAKKCVNAAVTFAKKAMSEFDERATNFEVANTRYTDVVKIRKQKAAERGGLDVEVEDTGSLFSAASNASNLSLQSNTSTSSIGSSVSSVISIKSSTTFTMTGDEEINRHRSKFNKGKRPKKQKKQKGTRRMQRGSEEELQSLVTALKVACVDPAYSKTISESCQFLIVWEHANLARELFDCYNAMCAAIRSSQQSRIEITLNEKLMAERQSRQEGDQHEDTYALIELPVENEVDALSCPPLDDALKDLFSLSL